MLNNRLTRVLAGLTGTIASIVAIVGILTKVFNWEVGTTTSAVTTVLGSIFLIGYIVDRMTSKVNKDLDERLVDIKDSIAKIEARALKSDLEQEKAICRLELAFLMSRQTKNTLAIEKKARHYFYDLGGNDWMGEEYSKWANKNGGDISVLMCDNFDKGGNNENRRTKI